MEKYDIDKLHESADRVRNAFEELEKSCVEYFHEFGENNGMDFRFELVKYSDAIKEYKEKYETIFKRVEDRIKYKNAEIGEEPSEERTIKRRQFK